MNCWHCGTELIWGGDHDVEDNEEYVMGKSFWLNQTGFNKAMTKLVTTEGSKKEREDLIT